MTRARRRAPATATRLRMAGEGADEAVVCCFGEAIGPLPRPRTTLHRKEPDQIARTRSSASRPHSPRDSLIVIDVSPLSNYVLSTTVELVPAIVDTICFSRGLPPHARSRAAPARPVAVVHFHPDSWYIRGACPRSDESSLLCCDGEIVRDPSRRIVVAKGQPSRRRDGRRCERRDGPKLVPRVGPSAHCRRRRAEQFALVSVVVAFFTGRRARDPAFRPGGRRRDQERRPRPRRRCVETAPARSVHAARRVIQHGADGERRLRTSRPRNGCVLSLSALVLNGPGGSLDCASDCSCERRRQHARR